MGVGIAKKYLDSDTYRFINIDKTHRTGLKSYNSTHSNN